jgi:hypothetical protein
MAEHGDGPGILGGPDAVFPRYAARDPLTMRLRLHGFSSRAARRLPRLYLPNRFEGVKEPEPSLEKSREQHWIEFRFIDSAGRPIVDVPYRIDLPDGSEQRGRLDSGGSARYEPQPDGTGTIRLAEIERASWGTREVEAHEEVELQVQTSGIDAGESVRFEVFRRYRERPGEEVAKLRAALDEAGRATASWIPDSEDAPGDEFVFKATVAGAWRTSEPLDVLHYAVSAEWSPELAREGDEVSLRVHLCGVRDGESASIKIFEKRWRDKADAELAQLDATKSGGAIETRWSIPAAAEPPPRGDDGRRDLYYTIEAAGLVYFSALLPVFPAEAPQ